MIVNNQDDWALARDLAERLRIKYPACFVQTPVPVGKVAHLLGIPIVGRRKLTERAILETTQEGEEFAFKIVYRANLRRDVARFAVAHEIGHALLAKHSPQLLKTWTLDRVETFANMFASELLVGPKVREQKCAQFRGIREPSEIFSLAEDIGISVPALFCLATSEIDWTQGLKKIWLRIQWAENKFTSSAPRLRITSACYDRSEFFVATNQSVVRFCGDDQWLRYLRKGECGFFENKIELQIATHATRPKFLRNRLPAMIKAVRQGSASDSSLAYYIALVDIG